LFYSILKYPVIKPSKFLFIWSLPIISQHILPQKISLTFCVFRCFHANFRRWPAFYYQEHQRFWQGKIMRRFRYIALAIVAILALTAFLLLFGCCTSDSPEGEGFAIYLIDDSNPPDEVPDINDVVIGETPLIGLEDIICYHSGTHELFLTDNAFARYQGVQGAFAVCVDRRLVYTGVFWNWFSSMSLDRIVILEKLSVETNNIIVIQTGYPGESFYRGDDPRGDDRIMNSLREAGKLIEVPATAEKIPTPFKGWELYSFERDEEWHYTLIFGTNRTKWLDEIVFEENATDEDGIYRRIGTGEIISLLSRLENAAGVFWRPGVGIEPASDSDVSFALPPDDFIDAVMHYADEFGLDLYIHRT
jgi:hypothetical protein